MELKKHFPEIKIPKFYIQNKKLSEIRQNKKKAAHYAKMAKHGEGIDRQKHLDQVETKARKYKIRQAILNVNPDSDL